jgi:hypothetical protein
MKTEIGQLLGINNFHKVNDILEHMKPEEMPIELLVGYIKATSIAKDYLPAWDLARNEVIAEIERRNLNVDELMKGV